MLIVEAEQPISKFIRVFLDGVDVSAMTFYAVLPDFPYVEGEGEIRRYVSGDDGRHVVTKGRSIEGWITDVQKETIKSHRVRWEFNDRAGVRRVAGECEVVKFGTN